MIRAVLEGVVSFVAVTLFTATLLLWAMLIASAQEPKVTTVRVKTVPIEEVNRAWGLAMLKQAMTGQGRQSMQQWWLGER